MAMSFLGMWVVMMMAMMLPSLVPMLRRYRDAVGGIAGRARAPRLGWLTALVGVAYFFVWILWRRGRVRAGNCAGGDGDEAAGAGARGADCGRRSDSDCRRLSILRVEGASPCLLPVRIRARGAAAWLIHALPGDTACDWDSTAVRPVEI